MKPWNSSGKVVYLRVFFIIIFYLNTTSSISISPVMPEGSDVLHGKLGEALQSLISETSEPDCSVLFIKDDSLPKIKDMKQFYVPQGFSIFETETPSYEQGLMASKSVRTNLSYVISEVRKIRMASSCLTIILLSNSPEFLGEFAEVALEGRLLVWSTRLLMVSTLPIRKLQGLFASYWIYSMMNGMLLTKEEVKYGGRCAMFSHLPYTDSTPQLVRIASWNSDTGFVFESDRSFYPFKFANFLGNLVNVTALPFSPYWRLREIKGPGGTIHSVFSGIDYFMLEAIASALNFTINVVPTADWSEVTSKVESRESFIASIIYALLPNRLEQYDYTYAFEFASPTFCMSKPVLKPQWQSLYHPLSDFVWISILVVLVLSPGALYLIGSNSLAYQKERKGRKKKKNLELSAVVQEMVGILFGQTLTRNLPSSISTRILVGSWLVFCFILGVAYRGNLTASLTLPKYPARAETLEELITVVDKVTMPSYGEQFRDFYSKSDSVVFQTLASIWGTVSSGQEGILQASLKRQAHIQARRPLELVIADQFTNLDGSTNLYLGRENVFPGLSGWPIPHDAPYKGILDRCIMAIREAGLYEKWSADVMAQVRKESKVRQLEKMKEYKGEEADVEGTSDSKAKPLTIIHLQGPLMLLLLGLVAGMIAFATEVLSSCY